MLYFCIPAYQRSPHRRRPALAPAQGVPGVAARVRGARVRRRQHRRHGRDARAVPQGDAAHRARWHRRWATPRAVDALCREASRRTRYPRRDAIVLLQADFTDQPESLPELVKRFDGGADVVVAERPADAVRGAAAGARRCAGSRPGSCGRSSPVAGVRDPFGTLRLFRVSVIRDLIKERGDAPLLEGDGLGGQPRPAAARGAARAARGDGGARAALRRARAARRASGRGPTP